MTFDTQGMIPRSQHLIVDRTVNFMAGLTAFTHRQMLDHKWTALLLVALEAGFIHVGHRSSGPGSCGRTVRIVAIGAGHMAFQHGMVMREIELGFLFHVAGETHFGVLTGIDNLNTFATARFHVKARGPVTHFAAFDLDAFHRNGDLLVGGELEILDLFGVTHRASFRADILGAEHLMVFQNLLEGFNIHFATGRKKDGTGQDQNREDDFFTVHMPEIPI